MKVKWQTGNDYPECCFFFAVVNRKVTILHRHYIKGDGKNNYTGLWFDQITDKFYHNSNIEFWAYEEFDGWIAPDEHQAKRKMLNWENNTLRHTDVLYQDIQCQAIGETDKVEKTTLIDDEQHPLYPIVMELGISYNRAYMSANISTVVTNHDYNNRTAGCHHPFLL